MDIHPGIKDFIDRLEAVDKRKLNYPEEVGELMQIAIQTGKTDEVEKLFFQAKFLVKTNEIIKRIGSNTHEVEKLSPEFQAGVQKAISLMKLLLEKAPAELSVKYSESFIHMQSDTFQRFMNLMSDLCRIKNWQVDGNVLPYEKNSAAKMNMRNIASKKTSEPLIQMRRSALMCIIFLVLFVFIDPPVTVLGWGLSLGIAAFLVYIILQIYIMTRIPKS